MRGLCASLDLRVIEIVNDWQADKDDNVKFWKVRFVGTLRKPIRFASSELAMSYIRRVPVRNRGYLVALEGYNASGRCVANYTWYPNEVSCLYA